jgi:DNA replication protein DnaC
LGYPKKVYDKAWEELERRRRASEDTLRARREEVRRRIPEIAEIERKMASGAASVARTIIAAPEKAEKLTLQLGRESAALQERRAALLLEYGYPDGYLAEKYTCDVCRDTGYRGREMCSCMKDLLRREAAAQLCAVSQSERCGFWNFELSLYPDEPVDSSGVVPRARMAEVLEACKRYAAGFSASAESLLLLGRTGLGKTHLSLAIAAAATEAGFGVIYTPVQRIMDTLEAEKFGRDSSPREQYSESTRTILACDLLVLDDLGTEFITQFSVSTLYNIINSRLVEGRPTIISTNLELADIEGRYSQRMVSRLVCGYQVLKFHGKDIRYIKQARQLAT